MLPWVGVAAQLLPGQTSELQPLEDKQQSMIFKHLRQRHCLPAMPTATQRGNVRCMTMPFEALKRCHRLAIA